MAKAQPVVRWTGRGIGLDLHRDLCEIAICEEGVTRSAGRDRSALPLLNKRTRRSRETAGRRREGERSGRVPGRRSPRRSVRLVVPCGEKRVRPRRGEGPVFVWGADTRGGPSLPVWV